MFWKIHLIFLLCGLQSFGFSLPQVQKREAFPSTPNVTYVKDINNKVLGVLKKVYLDLKNVTDSRQKSNEIPRTYGFSLTGQQGFVWNMLNDARKTFEVGGPSIRTVKEHDTKERSTTEEEQVEPQESEENIYMQIFSELLENDEFWNWLTGWIETYTELLDEHIKAEVQDVVKTQIKEYFDRVDYLINEEENSHADTQPDGEANTGQEDEGQEDEGQEDKGLGDKRFVNTQNIANSTVNNEYITNVYFTDPTAEKTLIDKLAKAIVAINEKKITDALKDADADGAIFDKN